MVIKDLIISFIEGSWLLRVSHLAFTTQELAALWVSRRCSNAWQKLFLAMGLQNELPPEEHEAASAAAEKKVEANGSGTEPKTPPRKTARLQPGEALVSPVKTSIRPQRVQEGKRAVFGIRQVPDLKLKPCKPNQLAGKRRHEDDQRLEDDQGKLAVVGNAQGDLPEIETESSDDPDRRRIRRARHKRIRKKAPISDAEKRMLGIKRYLNIIFLDWGAFQKIHRRLDLFAMFLFACVLHKLLAS